MRRHCIRGCIAQLKPIAGYVNICPGVRKKAETEWSEGSPNTVALAGTIHDRPVEVASRSTFGHWELDSVIGHRRTSGIHTTVERHSRFMVARRLDRVDAQASLAPQIRIVPALPAHALSSITVDNWPEFGYRQVLAAQTRFPTYFCDPYSVWQRRTIEHFNERLRRYWPKKTRFDNFTPPNQYSPRLTVGARRGNS